MRMRKSTLLTRVLLLINLSRGMATLVYHCLYLMSFSWQFILTSLQSAVLYSDAFWTSLLNDRKGERQMAEEFDRRESYSWRDSYDVRNSSMMRASAFDAANTLNSNMPSKALSPQATSPPASALTGTINSIKTAPTIITRQRFFICKLKTVSFDEITQTLTK